MYWKKKCFSRFSYSSHFSFSKSDSHELFPESVWECQRPCTMTEGIPCWSWRNYRADWQAGRYRPQVSGGEVDHAMLATVMQSWTTTLPAYTTLCSHRKESSVFAEACTWLPTIPVCAWRSCEEVSVKSFRRIGEECVSVGRRWNSIATCIRTQVCG